MIALVRAAEIELSFVPRRSDATVTVELDGEAVILDETHHRLHHLNATASLVWACCDGNGSVADIARDVAAAFGTAPIESDTEVLSLARTSGPPDSSTAWSPIPNRSEVRTPRGSRPTRDATRVARSRRSGPRPP